jgi:trehalose 6-phosphate synthase
MGGGELTDDVPVVIASNRGPISFRLEQAPEGGTEPDQLFGKRGGGGLVTGLAPLVESGRATWIAAALDEADRMAADAGGGVAEADGLSARLLPIEPDLYSAYYDDIANSTLWFTHHGLFDLTREPTYDAAWWESWASYKAVNQAFANAIVEHAPRNATVLVQDYHLNLLAAGIRSERDDLRLIHFHHTPFAGPDGARVMPPRALAEMLDGLNAYDACGFHTWSWATNYLDTQRRLGGREATAFASTLSSDIPSLEEVAGSSACQRALSELEELADGRAVIARVDRMELSKNIVRGFDAFNRLLEVRPDLRGAVVFLAACYPSRESIPAYARYRREVEAAAESVNERWQTETWTPVTLMTNDDFPRSVAMLQRYDVLLVNPIRDGLNLVAKEGPAVNTNAGQLALSNQAGVFEEIGDIADEVFPFDVEQTAAAIAAGLDRDSSTRNDVAERLRSRAKSRTPADWLDDQLAQ